VLPRTIWCHDLNTNAMSLCCQEQYDATTLTQVSCLCALTNYIKPRTWHKWYVSVPSRTIWYHVPSRVTSLCSVAVLNSLFRGFFPQKSPVISVSFANRHFPLLHWADHSNTSATSLCCVLSRACYVSVLQHKPYTSDTSLCQVSKRVMSRAVTNCMLPQPCN